jgi:hypothetical protein
MDTISAIVSLLGQVLTGTWRATGRTLTDSDGNAVVDSKGKPRREYAICAPESAQAGDGIVVAKGRTREIALFVLTERIGWRTEAGKREGLWYGQAVDPFTGNPVDAPSSGAVVTLE